MAAATKKKVAAKTPKKPPAPKKKKESTYDKVMGALFKRVAKTDFVEEAIESLVKHFCSSGNYLLDLAVGGKGFPAGVILEFLGEEHSGKTTQWILFGVQIQAIGGIVILFDAEGGFRPELAKLCGLSLDKKCFRKIRPKSFEAYCDMFEGCAAEAAKLNIPVLIVTDSVAGLCPKALTREKVSMSKGKRVLGKEAQIMSWFLKRGFVHDIAGSQVYTVFVNQTRSYIDTERFSTKRKPSYTTPAGKALPFYASIRLEMTEEEVRVGKGKKAPIGAIKSISVIKNRLFANYREVVFPFYYSKGYDDRKALIYFLREMAGVLVHHNQGKYKIKGVDFLGPLYGDGSWHKAMRRPKFLAGVKRIARRAYAELWEDDD